MASKLVHKNGLRPVETGLNRFKVKTGLDRFLEATEPTKTSLVGSVAVAGCPFWG